MQRHHFLVGIAQPEQVKDAISAGAAGAISGSAVGTLSLSTWTMKMQCAKR